MSGDASSGQNSEKCTSSAYGFSTEDNSDFVMFDLDQAAVNQAELTFKAADFAQISELDIFYKPGSYHYLVDHTFSSELDRK